MWLGGPGSESHSHPGFNAHHQFALRTAIWQADNERFTSKPPERPGRRWTTVTWFLSIGAGVLFMAGVVSLVEFASANLPSLGK